MKVTVITDSTYLGSRLTTLELHYPRMILPELNTYRVFSRSTQSSRAVSGKRLRALVREDDFIPSFTAERKGMNGELVQDTEQMAQLWRRAREAALTAHEIGEQLGMHKQHLNRIIEPYQLVKTVVSSTTWDNFFNQRLALGDDGVPLAQPEMYELALQVQAALQRSEPRVLQEGEWHAPYMDSLPTGSSLLISAARCARVSYLSPPGEDLALAFRLIRDGHWGPFEHVAKAEKNTTGHRNFAPQWYQLRALYN